MATYDGGAVTVGEIEDTIADSSPLIQARALSPESLREMLDRNLRFELLLQEAERRDYRHDPRVQKAASDNAVQLMISREVNAQIRDTPSTEEELRAYFERNKAVFSLRELRSARVIVLPAEAQARELRPQLTAADDAAFAALVEARGKDVPSKADGGLLRRFFADGTPESAAAGHDKVQAELARAVFELSAVGDVSDVIPMKDGFAIVKLSEIRPGYTPSFDEVKLRVRRRVEDERYAAGVEALVREQRAQLRPIVHAELVDRVQLD